MTIGIVVYVAIFLGSIGSFSALLSWYITSAEKHESEFQRKQQEIDKAIERRLQLISESPISETEVVDGEPQIEPALNSTLLQALMEQNTRKTPLHYVGVITVWMGIFLAVVLAIALGIGLAHLFMWT